MVSCFCLLARPGQPMGCSLYSNWLVGQLAYWLVGLSMRGGDHAFTTMCGVLWLVDGRQCVVQNIDTSGRSIRGTVGGVSGNVFPRTFYGVVPSVLKKSPRCYGVVRTSNTKAGSSLTCVC